MSSLPISHRLWWNNCGQEDNLIPLLFTHFVQQIILSEKFLEKHSLFRGSLSKAINILQVSGFKGSDDIGHPINNWYEKIVNPIFFHFLFPFFGGICSLFVMTGIRFINQITLNISDAHTKLIFYHSIHLIFKHFGCFMVR